MKRYIFLLMLACTCSIYSSCTDNDTERQPADLEEVVPGTNHNILVAYFSEPLPDGVDANTSASRVIVNGDLYGSVEYVATVIGEATGGDMVRIQTASAYPGTFDELADQADNERQNNIHPELSTEIEGFADYDVIFVGYPIWWYQMPMAMYSFFDKFDCRGKTVIPFSTHGGSGWSGTLDDIEELVPDATLVTGYSISRNSTATSREGIMHWLEEIGMTEGGDGE